MYIWWMSDSLAAIVCEDMQMEEGGEGEEGSGQDVKEKLS